MNKKSSKPPKIEDCDICDLRPWQHNARKHSRAQVQQIAASISEFGFTNPVLIDQNQTILAGHGRVTAAQSLGWSRVPCLYVEHMTDEQKRAYVLADNQIALNATWDEDILSEELKALSEVDLGFDINLTGFSIAEIDDLITLDAPESEHDPRDAHLPKIAPQRVNPGDIWDLGSHRLICGNSLDADVVDALMQGDLARMVFTDPPYNVPVDGHVSGQGKIRHREFAMAAGEMTPDAFTAFLEQVFKNLTRVSENGSIHFICMDWRHMQEVLSAAEGVYAELKNLIVWAKDQGGMGTFYRSRHELIFAYKFGQSVHTNSFELGQHGRYRTNVWQYRNANAEELALHPTVKPVEMIADAIRDVSGRGEVVVDLFGGSGSTLIAAEKTGRHARLCEIDPLYCDIILSRWEEYAKDKAVRIVSGGDVK